MSWENYVREVIWHLQNEQTYLKLSKDPTDLFAEEIKTTLEEMASHCGLDKETMKSLLPEGIKTSCFTSYLKSINQKTQEGQSSHHVGTQPTKEISGIFH